ncbi:MAG: hypothetical protein ABW208_16785 [Pyrinomonadaceae bacterium]
MSRVSLDEILSKAYRLAYFLHQDKGTAKKITTAAVLKLDVAMAVQSKRLYYIPTGRFLHGESRRADGVRNKVIFSDLHLLQRLIYSESEPYERRKELNACNATPPTQLGVRPLNDEDLLVYFVKHLVRITLKRNAFYATLGISRLLHNYSTVEAMDIYNAVIGEPERVKDDYYYRSRKGVLMQEMKQRFGELLGVCRRRRGEERFETQQCSSEHGSLVRECLHLFTPWNTRCPVPAAFDPLKTVIAHRTDEGRADESQAEVGRIHSVLHPDCFGRLVAGLGHDPPGQRLEVPRFFYQQADDPPPPSQRSSPNMNLNDEELVEIHNALAEQAGRRQTSPAALMRIVVDGVERASLNPVRASSVSFSTEEGAEIIEVKTADPSGDLLLATHLLAAHDDAHDARPHKSSIRLEGGQVLSLSIRQRENAATGMAEWLVDFSYRETHLRRAARLFLLRLGLLKDATNVRAPLGLGLSPGAALACGAILLCALAYLGYLGLRPNPPQETARGRDESASALSERGATVQESEAAGGSGVGKVDENRPLQTLPAEGQGAAPTAKSRRPVRQAPTQGRADAEGATVAGTSLDGREAQDDAAPNGAREETEATRNGDPRQRGVALGEVRRIYLEMSGDGPLDELRRELFAALNSSGLVIAAANTDEADAALKVSVTQTRIAVKAPLTAGSGATHGDAVSPVETRVEVSVRLVNAVGGVLWPRAGVGRGRRYSGVAAQIAPGVVRDLLAEVKAARSGHIRR